MINPFDWLKRDTHLPSVKPKINKITKGKYIIDTGSMSVEDIDKFKKLWVKTFR